jgi:hypothetical protein
MPTGGEDGRGQIASEASFAEDARLASERISEACLYRGTKVSQ